MRVGTAVTFYLGFVFLGAALLAPPIYVGVHALAGAFPVWRWLADHSFHRYVSRCIDIFALLGLWPFLRRIGVRSWADVGLPGDARAGRLIFCGFVWGWSLLCVAALLALSGNARALNFGNTWPELAQHLRNAGLACLFAAFFEELLFRGVLFMALQKSIPVWAALFLSSGVYALTHFFERPADPAPLAWTSGFFVLGQMVRGFTQAEKFIPGFLNLALVGIILAKTCRKYGSLYFSIGLHAGLIFWVKSYGFFTRPVGRGSVWFWGSGKLIDSWLAFLLLASFFALYFRDDWAKRKAGPSGLG